MPTTPTPTDFPDIKILSAIFVAVGGMIAAIVTWLDRRAKTQRDEVLKEHSADIQLLKEEIGKLTTRISALENGQREARKILVEGLMEQDIERVRTSIRNAIEVLH